MSRVNTKKLISCYWKCSRHMTLWVSNCNQSAETRFLRMNLCRYVYRISILSWRLSEFQDYEKEPWQIFVKALSGKTFTIATKPFATVLSLMCQIHMRGLCALSGLRLISGAKQLEPNRLLSDYDVQKGSTIHIVLRLSGGSETRRAQYSSVDYWNRMKASIKRAVPRGIWHAEEDRDLRLLRFQ